LIQYITIGREVPKLIDRKYFLEGLRISLEDQTAQAGDDQNRYRVIGNLSRRAMRRPSDPARVVILI
jgi:hypothetical protein